MSSSYLTELWEVLKGGGPIMLALAALSTVLYRNLWSLARLIHSVKRAAARATSDTLPPSLPYSELRQSYRSRISRQLRHARTLTVTAPLLGLLGTVVGMLDTFDVLSDQSQESITTSVADGISVALTTTQAGLMVAIPALFLYQWLKRAAQKQEFTLFSNQIQND